MSTKYTTTTFIDKAKTIYPNYDYSITEYKGSKETIRAICDKGHIFSRIASQFLIGRGCSECGKLNGYKSKLNTEKEKVEKFKIIHEEEFYETVFFDEPLTKNSLIICKICGNIFPQTTNNFLSGRGCSECAKKILSKTKLLTKEQFIEKAEKVHGKIFDYSKVEYKGEMVKVKIGCPICNNYFWMTPDSHWKGCCCNLCYMSSGEQKIYNYLKDKFDTIHEFEFNNCRFKNPLPFDFFIPELNTVIEYQGEQHYIKKCFGRIEKEFKEQKHRDWLKRKYCRDNKINYISIPFWEYENIENILSTLKNN